MTHYAGVVFKRIAWTAFWLTALIIMTAWQFLGTEKGQPANDSVSGHNIYRPQQLIGESARLEEALARFLESDFPASPAIDSAAIGIPCDARGIAVLRNRTMAALSLSESKATELLKLMGQSVSKRMGCAAWADLMTRIYARHQARKQDTLNATDLPSLSTLYAENVSWNFSLPCLFARQDTSNIKSILGLPNQCPPIESDLSFSTAPTSPALLSAQAISRARIMNGDRELLESLQGKPQLLTLRPEVQLALDKIRNCLDHSNCSGLPKSRKMRHVSVAVTDVQTGDILAVLCWGHLCNQAQMKNWGDLGALLIEAPPASTIKLIHALVLAQNPNINALTLQRQLKSSGQSDGVLKRNEWWEKQAICEGKPKSSTCDHPKLFSEMALEMGFNHNCGTFTTHCGRQSLIQDTRNLTLPGFFGRTSLSIAETQAAPMIDWATYNAIRIGQAKPDKSQTYLNTSHAVQSVIGAGDTRSSPLGLAHLSAQIMRLSKNQSPNTTNLIRPLVLPANASFPKPELVAAAKTVLMGMQKVVQPIEPGWKDSGTLAEPFRRQFGLYCNDTCGVWGKTGTVSVKDPNFAGASLFTGLVQISAFTQYIGRQSTQEGLFAIGVLAAPEKGQATFHDASAFSMSLLNALAGATP